MGGDPRSADRQPAVVCDSLGRTFRSRSLLGGVRENVALEALSLAIPRGCVFGLLGPNGAGKTTVLRILSTLLRPSRGRVEVLGFDVVRQAGAVRERIGLVLGGERGLYERLTGRENLRYAAALNLMPPAESEQRIDSLLDLVGLTDRAERLVEQYSRGMRQRLHLARGLITNPELLLLDEPTAGLDPYGAEEIRQVIPELAALGKTIILTTHSMYEADRLCDRVAIINKGALVTTGTPLDIKRRFAKLTVIDVTVNAIAPRLLDRLRNLEGVVQVTSAAEGPHYRVTVQTRSDRTIESALVAAIELEDVVASHLRDPTLEEAYLSILR